MDVLKYLNSVGGNERQCKPYQVFLDRTLKGGTSAGKFNYQKDVHDFDQCIMRCCGDESCDISLMMGTICFLVTCKSRDLCDISHSKPEKYATKIAYIRIALVKSGM